MFRSINFNSHQHHLKTLLSFLMVWLHSYNTFFIYFINLWNLLNRTILAITMTQKMMSKSQIPSAPGMMTQSQIQFWKGKWLCQSFQISQNKFKVGDSKHHRGMLILKWMQVSGVQQAMDSDWWWYQNWWVIVPQALSYFWLYLFSLIG